METTTLDTKRIKRALAYVHRWDGKDARYDRPALCRYAAKICGLSPDETAVLLRATNCNP